MRYIYTILVIFAASSSGAQDSTYGSWQQIVPVQSQPTQAPPVRTTPVATQPAPQTIVPGVSQPPQAVPATSPLSTRHMPRGPQPCGRGREATEAPIWEKFTQTFVRCAPGCSPGSTGTFGCRAGRSCHPSGQAIDVQFIECSGERFGTTSSRFTNFVNCFRETPYQASAGGRAQDWTVLFEESHQGRSRDCRGASLADEARRTICHWDHVHLDVGC